VIVGKIVCEIGRHRTRRTSLYITNYDLFKVDESLKYVKLQTASWQSTSSYVLLCVQYDNGVLKSRIFVNAVN